MSGKKFSRKLSCEKFNQKHNKNLTIDQCNAEYANTYNNCVHDFWKNQSIRTGSEDEYYDMMYSVKYCLKFHGFKLRPIYEIHYDD